eukprot:TRINITY_DN55887_c0_g1_i1.p1 TRINITY_DN55887_c0_g1~~TRINITY_DN55887_c0_g1_i1.p1  ORF type:complete len:423 (+),score=132.88 TRINITY_DN55887_c0_g1_i1:89-1270(+)
MPDEAANAAAEAHLRSGMRTAQRKQWALHEGASGEEGDGFWWCEQIGMSTFCRHMDVPCPPEEATDTQLWRALFDRQVREAFKMCQVCASPKETLENPFFVCGTCVRHCHLDCSTQCKEIAADGVWEQFAPYIRTCRVCAGEQKAPGRGLVPGGSTPYYLGPQGALSRLSSVLLPDPVRAKLDRVRADLAAGTHEAEASARIRAVLRDYYCPNGCSSYWAIRPSKGGEGVFATRRVPRYTRVGIMPGYPDPLCGEQTERGRPMPKYSLSEINAADYYNKPFPEYRECPAWCVNEPAPGQKSNTAWIQEASQEKGRMSVITVRDIEEGEEALLSYGPVYDRDYPYEYDAYSFHPRQDLGADVYELWYHVSRDKDPESRGLIIRNPDTDEFESPG